MIRGFLAKRARMFRGGEKSNVCRRDVNKKIENRLSQSGLCVQPPLAKFKSQVPFAKWHLLPTNEPQGCPPFLLFHPKRNTMSSKLVRNSIHWT